MSKSDFWVVVGVWYVFLSLVILAGADRFGADYMLRTLASPSLKIVLFLALFLLPIPFVLRRRRRS